MLQGESVEKCGQESRGRAVAEPGWSRLGAGRLPPREPVRGTLWGLLVSHTVRSEARAAPLRRGLKETHQEGRRHNCYHRLARSQRSAVCSC